MLKKAKVAFLLVIAFVFAVQSIPVAQAETWTANDVTLSNLLSGLGDAAYYGVVAKDMKSSGHSEASVYVDSAELSGGDPIFASDYAVDGMSQEALKVKLTLPEYHFGGEMIFGLYTKSGNTYVPTGRTAKVDTAGKESVTIDFGQIADSFTHSQPLYVFQVENDEIVADGAINGAQLEVDYGPAIQSGNRLSSYIGDLTTDQGVAFSLFQNEGTVYEGPYHGLELGEGLRLYYENENDETGYTQLPSSAEEAAGVSVDRIYIWDSDWGKNTDGKLNAKRLNDKEFTYDGANYWLYGKYKINVQYFDVANKAESMLGELAILSGNLAEAAKVDGVISGKMKDGVNLGDTPSAEGTSTVTGPITDGSVVSMYAVSAGADGVLNNDDLMQIVSDATNERPDYLKGKEEYSGRGLPIADNEYVVINVVVPSSVDAITMAKVDLGLRNSDGSLDWAGTWGEGEVVSHSRLIWNYVNEDGAPYEGKVYVGATHGGVVMVPKGSIIVDSVANNVTLIANYVEKNNQEIHQLSFASSSTYVHMRNEEEVDVSGKKIWDDNDNENGKRPTSIEVTLYAETYGYYQSSVVVKTIKVTEADGWAWSFEGLPKKDQYGNTLYYRLEEKVINNYAAQPSPSWDNQLQPIYDLNITNTYDETQIVVEGKKTWDDANNQDGKRPTSITVELQARYKKASESNWSGWEKLSAPAYSRLYGYGSRSSLFSGITDTLTVNADDNWEWNFGALKTKYWVSEYRQGHMPNNIGETDWEYRVVETEFGEEKIHEEKNLADNGGGDIKYNAGPGNQVDTGYDVSYSSDSYDITNTHTPEKIDFSGTKVWVPDTVTNKQEVTVNLYIVNADGTLTDTNLSAKANEGNNWTWTFTGLDKYKDGVEIQYTVKENNVPQGFWSEVSADGKIVYNIAKDVKLKGQKIWQNEDGSVMNNPPRDSVNVHIYRKNSQGEGTLVTTVTPSKHQYVNGVNWSWSVELPGYNPDGSEAEYYVVEEPVSGFDSETVPGEVTEEGNFEVQNWTVTNKQKFIDLTVTKIWADDNNAGNTRPTNPIYLVLLRKTEGSDNWDRVQNPNDNYQPMHYILDAQAEKKEYTFANLPESNDQGKKYEYKVVELEGGFYGNSSMGNYGYKESHSYTVDTNTGNIAYELKNSLAKMSLTGTKVWQDASNNNGTGNRPTDITLTVYQNGNKMNPQPSITWSDKDKDTWTWTVADLDRFDDQEKAYTYTVKEENLDSSLGYTVSYSEDGLTVYNTKYGRIRLYKESDSETEERRVNNATIVARKRLDGAVFKVYSDENCQNEVLTDHEKYPFTTESTSSEKGKLTIENVPYGTYWLKEVETPEDYKLYGDGVYKVVVNGATADVEGDAENEDYQGNNPVSNVVLNTKITAASGALALKKTDEDTGAPISGVVFTVYSDETCNTSVGLMTEKDATNNPGVYILENLPAGTYYVKETVPEGYRELATDHKYTVTVEAGKTINVAANGTEFDASSATLVAVTNKAITSISVEKVWDDAANNGALRPASIQVKLYKNGTEPVGEAVTLPITLPDNTQSWSYTWPDLPKYVKGSSTPITYTVAEVTTAAESATGLPWMAYYTPGEPEETTDGYTITNTLKTGGFTFTKKDESGTPLSGAVFGVYTDEGCTTEPVEELTSGQDGVVSMTGIDAGTTYYIKEITAPSGYVLNTTVYSVTIEAGVDNKPVGDNGVIVNEKAKVETSFGFVKRIINYTEGDLPEQNFTFTITPRGEYDGTMLAFKDGYPVDKAFEVTIKGEQAGGEILKELGLTIYKEGTYEFIITENTQDAEGNSIVPDGWYFEPESHKVQIPVTKQADGRLTVGDIKYNDKFYMPTIVNSYYRDTSFYADKKWARYAGEDDITLELYYRQELGEVDGEMTYTSWEKYTGNYEVKLTKPNGEVEPGEEVTWGILIEGLPEFVDNKAMHYGVAEEQLDGYIVTYMDASKNPITEDENGLRVLPRGGTITNTKIADGQARFVVNKSFNGTLTAGQFTFELLDENGNAVKDTQNNDITATNDANGVVTFQPITYTLADMKDAQGNTVSSKTFIYNIREVEGSAPGVTYDDTMYTAEVTVKFDATTGTLTTDPVKYYKADDATKAETTPQFNNEYAADGSVALTVKKILAGGTFKTGDSITFTLTVTEGQTDVVPMPTSNTVTLYPAEGSAEGTVSFLPIQYTLADVGKNYIYNVQETACNIDNVISDTTLHQVTVTIEDNGDGTLAANAVYADGGEMAVVTNTAVGAVNVPFTVRKTLNGADYTGAGENNEGDFTFVLKEGTTEKQRVSAVKAGAVQFAPITYRLEDMKDDKENVVSPKTFTYTISEEKGSVAGVTYSTDVYTAVVTLTYKEQTGELEYSVVYTKNAGAADEKVLAQNEVPVFANTTEKVNISVTKVWKDKNNASGKRPDSIHVQLYANGTAMDGKTLTLNAENQWADSFADLDKYGADDKEITYTVAEITTEADGETPLSWVKYYRTGEAVKTANGFTITNTAITSVSVTKVWEKKHDPYWWNESVGLRLKNGNGYVGSTVYVKEADNWKYTWNNLDKYDAAGEEIIYTVEETGMPEGYIQTGFTCDREDGNFSFTITNTYQELELNIPVSKAIEGTNTEETFNFKLEAVPSDAPPLPEDTTASIKGAGDVTEDTFGTIVITYDKYNESYDTNKLYSWTVKEIPGKSKNVFYDDRVYRYCVNVTLDEDGNMIFDNQTPDGKKVRVEIYVPNGKEEGSFFDRHDFVESYTTAFGERLTFTNTVVADIEVPLAARKTLNGQACANSDHVFTFNLSGDKIEGTKTATNGADGTVTFEAIPFTLEDLKNADGTIKAEKTFTYTISEEMPDAANADNNYTVNGVTYDNTVYTAVVTLTYNEQTGKLEHSVVYTKNAGAADKEVLAQNEVPVFANRKEAKVGEVELAVEKAISGRDFMEGDSFTFTLAAKPGEGQTVPMPAEGGETVTIGYADAEKVKPFGKISYTEADVGETYTYTITETKGSLPGMTYDETAHEVTVTITDNGDGTLAVTPNYGANKTAVTVTNTYANETTEIAVTKVWVETNAEQQAQRPESIDVQLYADNVAVDGKTLTLNAGN
ncbi:MAG: Cna B-type domain-containing protein, partial [Clostridia bacterium]|nr:Cna B-type domain-containing protein [Clostridia bacterium]